MHIFGPPVNQLYENKPCHMPGQGPVSQRSKKHSAACMPMGYAFGLSTALVN